MADHEFEAVLQRPEGVGTWTILDIPFSLAEAFGSKGQVRLKGTINGYPFRSSAMPHGDGTHYLVVNRAIRDAIGTGPGDRVLVVMEPDTGERTLTIPEDLQRALAQDETARAAFEALSYSHKKEYVEWIEGAKKEETRQRRIAQALEMLPKGSTPKSRQA